MTRLRPTPIKMLWILLLAALSLPSVSSAANERDLWKLWQLHMQQPDEHETVIDACKQFADDNALDAVAPVADGIRAWHLMKLKRRDEATAIMEKHLKRRSGNVNGGAVQLAQAWLSRMDFERIEAALKAYYRKEVAYPASLDLIAQHPQIPSELHPPLKDRWGTEWRYKLVGFKRLPGFENQKYDLSSLKLGRDTDVAEALAIPYADEIKINPGRIITTRANRKVLEYTLAKAASATDDTPAQATPAKKKLISVGAQVGSLYLAYVGEHIIIVCDRAHWAVFLKQKQ